jgi:hypothetical protein
MRVCRMGALLEHEMAAAIGAVYLVFLAQGEIDAGMAKSAVAAIASDPGAFNFNRLNRLHGQIMSFKLMANIGPDDAAGGPVGAGGATLTRCGADDTCLPGR